jgi:hypothetical protein
MLLGMVFFLCPVPEYPLDGSRAPDISPLGSRVCQPAFRPGNRRLLRQLFRVQFRAGISP